MKTKWIANEFNYDGTQLRPLYCYLNHGLLGNAIIAWRGACDISFEHMLDGEDFIQKSRICGSDMIHFVSEIFECDFFGGVALQRLFTSIVHEVLTELTPSFSKLIIRDGDDLYLINANSSEKKKLSISVATKSVHSVLIHFAINIRNEGTPVVTACLQDLDVDFSEFANKVLKKFSMEVTSIQEATWKVKSV